MSPTKDFEKLFKSFKTLRLFQVGSKCTMNERMLSKMVPQREIFGCKAIAAGEKKC